MDLQFIDLSSILRLVHTECTVSLYAVAGWLKLPWKCHEVSLRAPLKPQLEFFAREHSKIYATLAQWESRELLRSIC